MDTDIYEFQNFLADIEEPEPPALSPLEKEYFTADMLKKYEPCLDAMERVVHGDDEDEWAAFEEHFDNFVLINWCSNWNGKKYDLVFYGVSGYTGYLTMEYLKRVALKRNPEEFTFAFAGRTVSKVQEMRDREFAGTAYEDIPIIQASYDDIVSMVDLARSAHVILNVAGPYTLAQGEKLIDACCLCGTDYGDVSGEIPWTLRALELDAHAKAGGAIICPSSAVAGAYTDMLVYLCAKYMRETHGEELRRAIAYARGGGTGAGTSGGTLASRAAMNASSDWVRKRMADPFTLDGFVADYDRNGVKECTVQQGTGKVTLKVRREDTDAILSKVQVCPYTGVWRAPFVYAYFNTRILRRSNQLFADLENRPYGTNFNYQEYIMLPPEALAYTAAMKASGQEIQKTAGPSVASEKEALEAQGKYYKQGEGPPLEDLGDAWIGHLVWCQSESGREIKTCICGGDGYFETARASVEFAMSMRFDRHKLPHKGGLLNAVVAGQEPYARRIIDSGIKFKFGSWFEEHEYGPPGFDYKAPM